MDEVRFSVGRFDQRSVADLPQHGAFNDGVGQQLVRDLFDLLTAERPPQQIAASGGDSQVLGYSQVGGIASDFPT
jgi:hypothetical protein